VSEPRQLGRCRCVERTCSLWPVWPVFLQDVRRRRRVCPRGPHRGLVPARLKPGVPGVNQDPLCLVASARADGEDHNRQAVRHPRNLLLQLSLGILDRDKARAPRRGTIEKNKRPMRCGYIKNEQRLYRRAPPCGRSISASGHGMVGSGHPQVDCSYRREAERLAIGVRIRAVRRASSQRLVPGRSGRRADVPSFDQAQRRFT
jgi:hypothetical protein